MNRRSRAATKIQLGVKLTNGLGAGANPEIGRKAALEDSDKIIEALEGADMIFVTAGLGGGTGTGAAPIIASLASEMGALTVAVVTKPFAFEGKQRARRAEQGIMALTEHVDTLITIPNEKLMALADDELTFVDAFRKADEVLFQAVKGISEPINVYEVTGLGALRTHFELAARRGLTRFVGREAELAQMRHALEAALAGHGQVVAVMAEAGTGKSRLFHEFKGGIPTTCKVLEAYSVSHGKASAWLPVRRLVCPSESRTMTRFFFTTSLSGPSAALSRIAR